MSFVLVQLPVKNFLVVASGFFQTFKLQSVQTHAVPLTPSLENMFWYCSKTIWKYFPYTVCGSIIITTTVSETKMYCCKKGHLFY